MLWNSGPKNTGWNHRKTYNSVNQPQLSTTIIKIQHNESTGVSVIHLRTHGTLLGGFERGFGGR